MIRKFTHILTLFLGILACYICLPQECEHPLAFPFEGGGIVQPFAWSPQYDVSQSEARWQMSSDERICGSACVPVGGAGLMWSKRF